MLPETSVLLSSSSPMLSSLAQEREQREQRTERELLTIGIRASRFEDQEGLCVRPMEVGCVLSNDVINRGRVIVVLSVVDSDTNVRSGRKAGKKKVKSYDCGVCGHCSSECCNRKKERTSVFCVGG